MDAYVDSLRVRNRVLNWKLNSLLSDLDTQTHTAFEYLERKMAEVQALSLQLFTAIISASIVLLFLSYLAIHWEMKQNSAEKRQCEKLIDKIEILLSKSSFHESTKRRSISSPLSNIVAV